MTALKWWIVGGVAVTGIAAGLYVIAASYIAAAQDEVAA